MTEALLYPIWLAGDPGYVYTVTHEGKPLVERSRDPECDVARALLAKGITGRLTMLDGNTGKPRTIINIEKAAKMRVVEESKNGLRIRKHDPASAPPSPEDEGAGI